MAAESKPVRWGTLPPSHHKPAHAAFPSAKGVRLNLPSNDSCRLAALTLTIALCGCTNDTGGSWFTKPVDLLGRKGGYTYAQLGEEKQVRPITANDLVDANGACPSGASSPQTGAAPADPNRAAPGPTAPPTVGGGVGIGMSECDVVSRLGSPANVNLGAAANGERSAILTFKEGPRPGVYRFVGGRLAEMDRLEEPAPPPEPVKKKPVKPKPQKANDSS